MIEHLGGVCEFESCTGRNFFLFLFGTGNYFVLFFFVCIRQKLLHLISIKRNIALALAFRIHGLAHRSLRSLVRMTLSGSRYVAIQTIGLLPHHRYVQLLGMEVSVVSP